MNNYPAPRVRNESFLDVTPFFFAEGEKYLYRTAPNLYKLTESASPSRHPLVSVVGARIIIPRFPPDVHFVIFFPFFIAAAFASPSSPSAATSTTVSPQPTTTDAAERVISRDVDEVEVIPKRRRGRGIPPPPASPRRGVGRLGFRGAGGRMARDARFALAASNPPPPRGRRQCSGGHTPLYTEGGKSCKKKPRHSLCARLNLIGTFRERRRASRSSTLLPSFSSFQPPANRRRLYLSAGHVVASRPPCPFFLSLSLSLVPSPSCLRASLPPISSRSLSSRV